MHKLCANICSSPTLCGEFDRDIISEQKVEKENSGIWSKIYEFLIEDKFSRSANE
jgi:hypothetical protein